jgi:hypothetical protein
MTAPSDRDQLKDAVKLALIKVLEEWSDHLRDALAEAIEDVALVRAIQEGETREVVLRADVFRALEARA